MKPNANKIMYRICEPNNSHSQRGKKETNKKNILKKMLYTMYNNSNIKKIITAFLRPICFLCIFFFLFIIQRRDRTKEPANDSFLVTLLFRIFRFLLYLLLFSLFLTIISHLCVVKY